MKKKILILTASPERDKLIDDQIADELRALGNEVWVHPCLRGGRQKVIEIQPNVTVIPPIKNPFARDTAETLKKWGIGVVVRHTEASVDWNDFKKLAPQQKNEILGVFRYPADGELVWGKDEAEILNRRQAGFPTVAIGCLVLDIYHKPDFESRFLNRAAFNEKYGLTKKKTMLFASCWSYADNAPDLNVDEMLAYKKERESRDRWLDLINKAHWVYGTKWNLILKVHPGEDDKEYKDKLHPDVKITKERSAPEFLKNSDLLIHAGSTMAVEAHVVGIPAFQYGDINLNEISWATKSGSPLSQVSPKFSSVDMLLRKIKGLKRKSNANPKTLQILEKGRFGIMDGGATKRAADLIHRIPGQCKFTWPDSLNDYSQPNITSRTLPGLVNTIHCGICGHQYYMKSSDATNFYCPWCGAKTYRV